MGKLLDMVKVVAFAVQEGRVAIHCHAGNNICFIYICIEEECLENNLGGKKSIHCTDIISLHSTELTKYE